MASRETKSPAKPRVVCKGCGKKVQMLLSHLKRTEDPCKNNYDMDALEAEAKTRHNIQMATRNRERYYNDPEELQKKRAASKKRYQEDPEKKKATMSSYNEKYREDINMAMRDRYVQNQSMKPLYECPTCELKFISEKIRDRHIAAKHSKNHLRIPCDICEKEFEYHHNLSRHLKEVHGEAKYKCEKCPAAFTRGTELEKHIKSDWHYLEFECGICSKNLVFKTLAGLIQHVMVKRPEEKVSQFHVKKSGTTLTCRSQEGSIQLEEGQRVMGMSRKQVDKADRKRMKDKEEYINAGLTAAYGTRGKPSVELQFIEMKHSDNYRKDCCISCRELKPYSEEYCKIRFRTNWHLNLGTK